MVGVGEAGVDGQGSSEARGGLGRLALALERQPQVVMRFRIAFIQRQRPGARLGGLLESSQAHQGRPQVGMGRRVSGVEGQGLAVGVGRLVRASRRLAHPPQIGVVHGGAGIEGDGGPDQREGVVVTPALEGDHPPQVPGVRLIGHGAKDIPVGGIGLIQPPGVMVFQGGGEGLREVRLR